MNAGQRESSYPQNNKPTQAPKKSFLNEAPAWIFKVRKYPNDATCRSTVNAVLVEALDPSDQSRTDAEHFAGRVATVLWSYEYLKFVPPGLEAFAQENADSIEAMKGHLADLLANPDKTKHVTLKVGWLSYSVRLSFYKFNPDKMPPAPKAEVHRDPVAKMLDFGRIDVAKANDEESSDEAQKVRPAAATLRTHAGHPASQPPTPTTPLAAPAAAAAPRMRGDSPR